MKAPDKIYARIIAGTLTSSIEPKEIFGEKYPEYIRKDALLEWAEEKMNINIEEADKTDDRFTYGVATGLGAVIDKLNSL